MPKGHIITGLDIGTGTIKVLVAQKKPEDGELQALSLIQEPAVGIRKGVVINPDEVSAVLERILEQIKAETGTRIDSVYVNAGGSH